MEREQEMDPFAQGVFSASWFKGNSADSKRMPKTESQSGVKRVEDPAAEGGVDAHELMTR